MIMKKQIFLSIFMVAFLLTLVFVPANASLTKTTTPQNYSWYWDQNDEGSFTAYQSLTYNLMYVPPSYNAYYQPLTYNIYIYNLNIIRWINGVPYIIYGYYVNLNMQVFVVSKLVCNVPPAI